MTEKKLFLSSWPSGELIVVDIIEERRDMPGYFYIRYANGGTDTTTNNFLFDIPYGLDVKKEAMGGINHCTQHGGYGFMSDCVVCNGI